MVAARRRRRALPIAAAHYWPIPQKTVRVTSRSLRPGSSSSAAARVRPTTQRRRPSRVPKAWSVALEGAAFAVDGAPAALIGHTHCWTPTPESEEGDRLDPFREGLQHLVQQRRGHELAGQQCGRNTSRSRAVEIIDGGVQERWVDLGACSSRVPRACGSGSPESSPGANVELSASGRVTWLVLE